MAAQPRDRPGRRCPTSMTMTATFGGRLDQIPVARRLVAGVLRHCPAGQDTTLMANELVANAVMHSASGRGGTFRLSVTHRAGDVRVEVADQGGPWSPRQGERSEHGRGLLIVQELASGWGITGDDFGRTVWLELACTAPGAAPCPGQRTGAPSCLYPSQRPVAGYDGAVTDRTGDAAMHADQDRLAQPEHAPEQAPPPDRRDAYDPPVHTEVAWTDAGAESVNPDNIREPTGSLRDLHDRVERLPEWHPSSPFREDGSRKPEPLDLSQYELPLPDDPDYSPNQDLPPPHDNPPSESWDGRGRHLTADQSRAAEETREWFRTAEGRDSDGKYGEDGLTPAMRRIEGRLEHGHLVEGTEEFALKGIDRLKEKLADMIKAEPDKSAHELAREIHDGVRYTFLFKEERYLNGVKEATNEIGESGYELAVLKNTWGSEEYKGINTRWHDHATGIKFEVQFHTEASWAAKQQTHEAYEGINDPATPPGERERLRAYQRDVSAQLENPPGWEQIDSYRKEGW